MSKLSKTGVEDVLNIPSVDELTAALALIRDSSTNGTELYYPDAEFEDEPEMSIEEMKNLVRDVRKERLDVRQETNISVRQQRLERISEMATKYFEDAMDKAFNKEDKFSADLINASSGLLKVATDAETTLINSDIKMAELQLRKEKQDHDVAKMNANSANAPKDVNQSEGTLLIDRNSLIKEMLGGDD